MGESLCISCGKDNVKIVRPSNVVGINSPPNLFVQSIINDAINKNKIILHSTLDSEKDYVYIDDVVDMIYKISTIGKSNIYNIAMGKNTESKEIVEKIVSITGCDIKISEDAKRFSSPIISIDKLSKEFGYVPSSIVDNLEKIVNHHLQK
jgi:nucleoside-diphosphate-sugar epimerase